MTSTNKPTVSYWIIAVIALIWYIMGVMSYLRQVYMTDDMMASMTPEQQELLANTPAWSTGLFAVAVFAGLLGSFLLLMRKKLATPVFLISLIAVLINMGYSFFATNQSEVFGKMHGIVMPIIVIVIAVFLYMYSKKSGENSWMK